MSDNKKDFTLKSYKSFFEGLYPQLSVFAHKYLNPHYSQLFYSKAKLPAIFGNALNFYSSKVGDNLSFKNYCASQIY